jgi:hypothetical protein
MSNFPMTNISLSNILTATGVSVAPFSASNLYSITNTSTLPAKMQPVSWGFFRGLSLVVAAAQYYLHVQPKYGYIASSLNALASGTPASSWPSIGTVAVNLTASTDTSGGTNAVLTKSGTDTFVSFTPKQFFVPASPFTFTLRDGSNNPVGGMTFAINLRISSNYDGQSQRVFQLANTSTDESNSIILFRPGTGNDMRFLMFNGTGMVVDVYAVNAWTASTSANVFTTHIITYEHTASPTLKWYINGVLQSTTGSVGTLNGNRSLAFGGLGKSANPTDPYFRGDIKHFFVYDRALLDNEVSNLNTFLSSGAYAANLPIMTGIGLWLDAGNSASLSLSSSNVTSWKDSSANTYTLSQSNAVSKPTYNTIAYNSKPGLVFNGSNFIAGSNYTGATLSAPATVCYVISNYTGGMIMYKGNSSYVWSNSNKKIWMASGGNSEGSRGNQVSFVGNSCGFRYTNSVASSSFVVVCAVLTSSTNIDYYFDGVLQSSSSLGFNNYADSGTDITIGGPSVQSSPFLGTMHELVHYNKVLTSSEIRTLSTFLKNKW